MLARTADHTYTARTLATSSPSSHLTWTNGDGVGGAPTLVDTLLDTRFLRGDGADTMAGPLTYSDQNIDFGYLAAGQDLQLRKGASDEFLIVDYDVNGTGARDYDLKTYFDGSIATLLHTGNALPHFASATSLDNTTGGATLLSDSVLAVTIPSYGTWDIEYFATISWDISGSSISGAGGYIDIEEKIDADPFAPVQRFEAADTWVTAASPGTAPKIITGVVTRESATASSTYQYRVNWAVSANSKLFYSAGNNQFHRVILKTYRTG